MLRKSLYLALLIAFLCSSSIKAHEHSHGGGHHHSHGGGHHHSHGHNEPPSFKYSKQANEEVKAKHQNHEAHSHSHGHHHEEQKQTKPQNGK
jgi:hypothetical protein